MSGLPFLIVHGAIAWKVALAALVGIVLGVFALVRRAIERGRTNEMLAVRLAGLAKLRTGNLTLGAIVRGGTIIHATRGDATIDHVVGAPYLETEDGTRVDLVGPVRVVLGRRALSRPWIPRVVPAEVRAKLRGWGRVRVDVAQPGDLVNVRGLGAQVTDVADVGFRDAAVRWTIAPDPEFDPQITIAAMHPAIRPPARPLVQVALAVGVALAARAGLDKLALASHDWPLRAMSPSYHGSAVAMYADEVHYRPHTPERTALLDALDELQPPANGTIACARTERRIEDRQYDEALRFATDGCDELAITLLAFFGRFDEAYARIDKIPAEHASWLVLAGRIALATGHRERAAQIAEQLSPLVLDIGEREHTRAKLACLAPWLRTLDDAALAPCEDLAWIGVEHRTHTVASSTTPDDQPLYHDAQGDLLLGVDPALAALAPPAAPTRQDRVDLAMLAYARGDIAQAIARARDGSLGDDGEALAKQFEARWTGPAAPPTDSANLLHDGTEYALLQRDAAHRAHDDAEVARWQAVVDRFLKLYADPDRAIALIAWFSVTYYESI